MAGELKILTETLEHIEEFKRKWAKLYGETSIDSPVYKKAFQKFNKTHIDTYAEKLSNKLEDWLKNYAKMFDMKKLTTSIDLAVTKQYEINPYGKILRNDLFDSYKKSEFDKINIPIFQKEIKTTLSRHNIEAINIQLSLNGELVYDEGNITFKPKFSFSIHYFRYKNGNSWDSQLDHVTHFRMEESVNISEDFDELFKNLDKFVKQIGFK